ncbi:transposase IS116/IS110/IS902 family protein [Burkholderia cenocepacia HI2424]|uniref:IS110-like element ISBma3 family transposase n=15 Tax=Burkholderia TaxID=32008 RepID=A0A427NJW6_9BURK|nr:transposase IS116/IS110/IS902 family protein [Burkholderia cenocepacia HI2424]PNO65184.1 IS110 family transposase ISBma3 [Burkholderia cenocepacia]ABK10387.1 transposase IS116/IS110/IS902 family protein [Burkholderia cenocepacia HI2424]PNO73969.1 IS110 family transposase ISBma3 [Burkholderia cenocepacia]PNO74519.1 IS110 family transposase ISBma3 [Burkholderia cenocepacia]
MPRLATVVAGQSVHFAQTAMQDTQQHDAVDVFVGVDVGKGQHHAVALDRNGKRLYNKALPNDEVKLRALIAELKTHGRLLFVVDQPSTIGALPVAVARAEGVLVAYLPGLAMRRIADLHAGEAKTDARDAAIIAEAARSMPHTLRSLRLADEQLAELTMLCGFDDDLAAQVTQTSNRIRGLLTQIHPALERVLGPRLDHPAVLDLLERYPSPAALASTTEKTLANRLTKLAPRMGKGLAAEIVQALSEQAVTVPGTQAATIVMPRLAQQLAALRKQRDEVAAEVERLVLAHPLWPVLTSMPGVGVRTAARLLTEVAHKAFASAAHLAAYAGLAPVTRRSGSSIRGEHPSRRGNKVLKRALFLSAFAALRDPVSRAYYSRKIQQGKRHNQALIALARRRCDVLFAMLRDGTIYQPKSAPNA